MSQSLNNFSTGFGMCFEIDCHISISGFHWCTGVSKISILVVMRRESRHVSIWRYLHWKQTMVPSYVAAAALRTTTMIYVHLCSRYSRIPRYQLWHAEKVNTTSCSVPPCLDSKSMLHKTVGDVALPVKRVSALGATKDLMISDSCSCINDHHPWILDSTWKSAKNLYVLGDVGQCCKLQHFFGTVLASLRAPTL